jgi:hypothetical protein
MEGTSATMGLTSVLRRVASRAPVRVYPIAGVGERDALQDLSLEISVRFVLTPRAANVLLVAGRMPSELIEAVESVHEALTHPRAVVLWRTGPELTETFPNAVTVGDDPVETLARVHADLVTGVRASSPPLRPDIDPAPWRGVGPYGQGGSGMTGGVPYGRPLADRAPDRDGLTLDQLSFRVGPFWHPLPPGLLVEVDLQGDVIQGVGFPPEAYAQAGTGTDIFMRALTEPVPIAELELARARSHLRRLADAVALHGLDAVAERILRLAVDVRPHSVDPVEALSRRLRRAGLLGWATSGVGAIRRDALAGMGLGPTSRASGLEEDVRSDDTAYRTLGFEPIVATGADVAARWRVRLAEAVQSLRLAAHAGDRVVEPAGRVESPRGRLEHGSSPTARLMYALPAILHGLEWGDAVATIASLDIDLGDLRAHVPSHPEEVVR